MKEITLACEAFQKLLEEQLERIRNMNGEKTDFSTKKQVTIGVIDGDGIGPVITAQATRVLEKLLAEEIAAGSIVIKQIEGLTIENRMACGKAIPDDVLAEIKTCDVLLKGPTTTPMGGKMESANVAMRRELDLYANCRPVSIPEKNIDWMFFRENTEGEYVLGSRGVVTKANIMKKTDGKFTAICHEVAADYPGITVDDYYIDIMTANLLKEPLREQFQVVLLPNLYGDIITDEAAQIQGGVGTAGSANVGDRYAMFEAIHGSAPRMIERGMGDYANPASIIKAAAMLLRHICRADAAARLEKAMAECKVEVKSDGTAATAAQYADAVMALL